MQVRHVQDTPQGSRLWRNSVRDAGAETIERFGRQWQAFQQSAGYFGSPDLLADVLDPLVRLDEIRGRRVVEIGSGSGRIVNMLLAAGAGHVTAVEPAGEAFAVLQRNVAHAGDRVSCLNLPGDRLPSDPPFELAMSIGVLHHIPDPDPVVKAVHAALPVGGRFVIWVYGHEGNEWYLRLAEPLRRVTVRLPHWALTACSAGLLGPLWLYMAACRVAPLPLRGYLRNHFGRLSPKNQLLTIYDQLNPTYAKYYRRDEVTALLERNGFADVRVHHRHGYSWTAVGTKTDGGPGCPDTPPSSSRWEAACELQPGGGDTPLSTEFISVRARLNGSSQAARHRDELAGIEACEKGGCLG